MLEKRLRLWSGLVLAAYIIPHLFNHIFGIFSLGALEAVRDVLNAPWENTAGGIVLYSAFLIHFVLGLVSLYRRPHLRMPKWEAVQLVLGLLVWPLLLTHAIGTRFTLQALDVEPTYRFVIASIWFYGPWMIVKQTALLLVVWGHLAVGLHFWLRLKPWYGKAVPYLYPAAVLLPVLAALGFLRAEMEVSALAADPAWVERVFADYNAAPAGLRTLQGGLEPILLGIVLALVGLALAARRVRHAYRNRRGTYSITLPEGRTVRTPVGQTVLEALRGVGIPHASVCGGRGRCTTCRISVGEAAPDLPPPEPVERQALERIDADASIRLACQVRPRHDLRITPLLPPSATAVHGRLPGGVHGREQEVAVLFADLRESTKLGEQRLPYDVLFVLNLFFAEMTAALTETDGHYAQFAGDGLMALYGIESGVEEGSRKALRGAGRMLERLDSLNRRLRGELREPLRMGIGIHAGVAIVGTMGPPKAPVLSAIGDTINAAARLEGQSKELGRPVVVSEDVFRRAGIDTRGLTRHDIAVKGRAATLGAYALSDPANLVGEPDAEALASPPAEVPEGPGAPVAP